MEKILRESLTAYLHRSREDLAAAVLLLQQGHVRATLSRAYYAAFHAASALLLSAGITRSKHSGVHAALGEFFIKTKRLAPRYGEIYTALREAREAGDYDIHFVPIVDLAKRALTDAVRFVDRVEQYLAEQGLLDPAIQ